MVKGMHHVGVSTRNLKRLLEFYCEALDFEVLVEMEWKPGTELGSVIDRIIGINDSAAKLAMVKKDGVVMEIFEYTAPEPKPVPSDWRVSDHGYTHICLEVDDIDAAYDRLKNSGATFHVPPPMEAHNGVKAVYCRDPEGHVIELVEISQAM
jgi:glyoxylase I family protein